MLLKHDPEMPVTEGMFFTIFGEPPSNNEQNRSRLVQLLPKFGKKLMFDPNA